MIFADGQFAGVDEQWVFEAFGRMMEAIVEVGLLAKTGAWDQLEALPLSRRLGPFPSGEDPTTYLERRAAGLLLVQERKFKGEAAQLAELYSSLPALWK